jgi:hypothetical protein
VYATNGTFEKEIAPPPGTVAALGGRATDMERITVHVVHVPHDDLPLRLQ